MSAAGGEIASDRTSTTYHAIDRVVRESAARLLAFLAARSRDLAAAEDALADACRIALETWPATGVPAKPEAWLLTVARRRLIDRARHHQMRAAAQPDLLALAEEAEEMASGEMAFPDERLKLMFICAHPAIDPGARTPLMLQIVLGLDALRIAAAFLVQPAAMGQRLSRAKTKIRDAGIGFDLPRAQDLPARTEAVLDAIYAAYGTGWESETQRDAKHGGLASEAIDLGRLLLHLMPREPDVQGLLALMLFSASRRAARRDASGAYVPLADQDVARWSMPMIAEANRLLVQAGSAGGLGRFQLEAAIQSVHAARAVTGETDWSAIAGLYDGLVQIAPSIGALVGRAAAIAEAGGTAAGWQELQAIPAEMIAGYQPYWAVAAHLLAWLQRIEEAKAAYARAIELSKDPAQTAFLRAKLAALGEGQD
jgi:predicted RNA polymerase sigma factor